MVHRLDADNPHRDALSRHPLQVVTVESSLNHVAIAQAQRSDSVLSQIVSQLEANQLPQLTGNWKKFPFRRYLKLRHRLSLQESVLYCKMKHHSAAEKKLLNVVPCHSPKVVPSHSSRCCWPSRNWQNPSQTIGFHTLGWNCQGWAILNLWHAIIAWAIYCNYCNIACKNWSTTT